MGKFRVRSKNTKKGVRWARGQSSSSNPQSTRHRDAARTRSTVLGGGASGGDGGASAPSFDLGPSRLTAESLLRHDALLQSGNSAELDNDGEAVSLGQTHKTFETFASDWTNCDNASFDRLVSRFNPRNPRQMEMLVVLGAVTDVIREKGGDRNDTEYFAALLTMLESSAGAAAEEERPVLGLMAMVVKKVPREVLQAKYPQISKVLSERLAARLEEKEDSEASSYLCRCLIGCLSVLLRAQSLFTWKQASTARIFEGVLSLCVHPRPKVRKAAQRAVCSVLAGSLVMETEDAPTFHPAAAAVARHCLEKLRAWQEVNATLHTLVLLKEVLQHAPEAHVKSVCDATLGLMQGKTHPYMSVCALQMLHGLFSARPAPDTLSAELNARLATALHDFRPSVNDPQPAVAWLTVMQEALINLARLDAKLGLAHAVSFFSEAKKGWSSDRREVAVATTAAFRAVLSECVRDHAADFASDAEASGRMERLFQHVFDGLGYQYHSSWGQVLVLASDLFSAAGPPFSDQLTRFLPLLADRRAADNFHFCNELDYAVGRAVRVFGPRAVLDKIPLGITGQEGESLAFPRSWLLPVLRENLSGTELSYFAEHFLPLSHALRDAANRCASKDDAVGNKIYSLLESQTWALLPGFCNGPVDLPSAFPRLAQTMGKALESRKDGAVRGHVLAALRQLVSKCKDDASRAVMAGYARNYLPILCNIYTSEPTGSQESNQRASVYATLREYATVAPADRIAHMFDKVFEVYSAAGEGTFAKEATMDILKAYLPHQDGARILKLYREAVRQLATKDHTLQKKAYRILEELCRSESDGCVKFVRAMVRKGLDGGKDDEASLQRVFLRSLSKASPSSQAPRLRCLVSVVQRLTAEVDDEESPVSAEDSLRFVKAVIPEAILCVRAVNASARQSAVELIASIGEAMIKFKKDQQDEEEEEKDGGEDTASALAMTEFVTALSAGLAGDPTLVHCTLLALATVVFRFRDLVPDVLLDSVVDNVSNLMTCNSREVVGSCLSFVKVFLQVNPVYKTGRRDVLEKVVGAVAGMSEDCKRHHRQKTRDVLDRLVRKFGFDVVSALVPRDDETMHKRLKNIQKAQARKQRDRERRVAAREGEEDDEEEAGMGSRKSLKARTMEEILNGDDDDSDMDLDDEDDGDKAKKGKMKTKKGSARQTFIVEEGQEEDKEDGGEIMDFLDPSAARKVTSKKPQSAAEKAAQSDRRKKAKNGGFEIAADGRLLIKDDSDDDEDDGRSDEGADVDSDDDDEENTFKAMVSATRKRKMGGSVASGATGRSRATSTGGGGERPMKYQAGGSGIHRPISNKGEEGGFGSEYRSAKASGDIKRKGRPDPYAYVPLQKSSLNRRKRQKFEGQFKSVVKSAKKGAAAGSKANKANKGGKGKRLESNLRRMSI